MAERTGVAIVGAGPAGLVLAHLLNQAGLPFIVVERQTFPDLGRRPKAGLIEYRTVQQLRQVGVAGTVLDFTARNHRCEFRTPAGSAVLDYGALTGGRPHYLYPQHELVRRLAEPLPVIWRAQAFSNWFLQIILAGGGEWGSGEEGGSGGEWGTGGESLAGERCGFARGLREGWVSALASDPLLARWFAHAYAGVDPDAA